MPQVIICNSIASKSLGTLADYGVVNPDQYLPPFAPIYIPTCAAAVGVTLLNPAYTGPCCQVNVAGVLTDIPFLNGYISEPALQAAAGAGTATVSKWYDQTGNARHALPLTASGGPVSQPVIVSAGVIVRDPVNNLVALRFGGSAVAQNSAKLGISYAVPSVFSMVTRVSNVGTASSSAVGTQTLPTTGLGTAGQEYSGGVVTGSRSFITTSASGTLDTGISFPGLATYLESLSYSAGVLSRQVNNRAVNTLSSPFNAGSSIVCLGGARADTPSVSGSGNANAVYIQAFAVSASPLPSSAYQLRLNNSLNLALPTY
jgi:hypothetical protein